MVLQGECHLEHRRVRVCTREIELLDDHLEGHVGIRYRCQVGLFDDSEQVGEGVLDPETCAQRETVDEHSDQVVEGSLTAACVWRANRDVGTARKPVEQHQPHGMQQHEQRHTVLEGELIEFGRESRTDRELMVARHFALRRRPQVIQREIDEIGRAIECFTPERELPTGDRVARARVAEHRALPQRVVGVLHRELAEVGTLALTARTITRDHVTCQRPHRCAVCDDVVDDEHQDVVGTAGLEQSGA